MTNQRQTAALAIGLILSAFSGYAWEGNVVLNRFAVKDGNGAIQVLGTEGSWSNHGDTKEKVFDGDASTFFDPPESAKNTDGAWAGIALTTPSLVQRVRYAGRSGWGSRMEGCLYQGANSPDFSDAETFLVAAPPSNWDGSWHEVELDNVYGPYTYLRVKGTSSNYCGNAAEVEFIGLAESGSEIPEAPSIDWSWLLNRRAGFQLTVHATVPQIYRVQRREDANEDFATFALLAPNGGGEVATWIDSGKSKGGEYRVRGVNANGKGPWAYFTITNRNEAVGTWIGTSGSYQSKGDVGANAFDGNPLTIVDAPNGNGSWTGLDLGAPQYIAGVRLVPRAILPERMVGGRFQGANQSDFSNAVTLHTIANSPDPNGITEVSFGENGGYFRYVRYVAPNGSYGNVAEIAFLLPEGAVDGPEAPTVSTPPGFSTTNVAVTLDFPVDGAEIYYTLDGSSPVGIETANCFRYRTPLVFGDVCSKTNRLALIPTNPPEMWNHAQYGWKAPSVDQPNVNVLRARAFKNGLASTNEFAGTWLVGTVPNQHTLRVVSLQTDEANFFSDATGLMVPGDVYNRLGWNGHSVGLPNANYFQHGEEWERPVVFELFETNREEVASQTLGVRMHGAWSRSCAQKTMGFYARKEYGKKKLKCQLFGDDSETDFKRFLLRNSGNDWYKTGLRDAFGQSLFRGWVKTGTQGYEPSVVYLNGEYWGIMNLRHHYSAHLFESQYGADPDNLDFIKLQRDNSNPYEIQEGGAEAYNELLAYLRSHNLATDLAAYEYVCTRIDVDDLIEHNLIHMFTGNTDWPDNNQGFWRERVEYSPAAPAPHDGRWRFCAYDTDHGLGLGCSANTDMVDYAKKHQFFASLCVNRDFINRFASRCADLLNSALAPERTTAMLDAAAARVRGEIPRHIARWSRQGSLNSWENELNNVRSYLNQRGDYLRSSLDSYFSVGSSYPLTVVARGDGRVQVNSLASGEGEGRIALPFTGRYFANVPVKLTATPEPGSRFVAWIVGDNVVRTEASIEVSVTSATTATAYFKPSEPPKIVVNEVMSDADAPDWFELHNVGAEDFNLGGCWLTDDNAKHLTEIPVGVTIPAGGFLLVRADDSFLVGVDADGVLSMPFGLGKKGDEVNLWNADRSQLLAHVAFGAATHNVSMGCWPNGSTNEEHWVSMSVPTPGAPNRSPLATGAWLPDGVSTQVVAGVQVTLSCAVTNTTLAGSYAFAEGPALGAGISNAGLFTWNVPTDLPPGVREFRIVWTSLDGTASDEATVMVQVMKRVEDEELPIPPARPQAGATRNGNVPLIYWTQPANAVAYEVERAISINGNYSTVATLGKGVSHWLDESATATTNWYRIVARTKYEMTSVSEPQQAWGSGYVHKLEGLIVGTSGSWNNTGRVKELAFDGDTSTFFDAPNSLAWLGLDLGSSKWRVVNQFRCWPRADWSSRMTGSKVQVGCVSDGVSSFENPTTIYTVSPQPAEKRWTTVAMASTNEWRFIRYYNDGGHGNASELEFWGFDDVPAKPASFTVATNVPMLATLTWPTVPHAEGYLVWTNNVVCGYVSTNAATFLRSTRQPSLLGVAAVNGNGQGERRQILLPKAPPLPSIFIFR